MNIWIVFILITPFFACAADLSWQEKDHRARARSFFVFQQSQRTGIPPEKIDPAEKGEIPEAPLEQMHHLLYSLMYANYQKNMPFLRQYKKNFILYPTLLELLIKKIFAEKGSLLQKDYNLFKKDLISIVSAALQENPTEIPYVMKNLEDIKIFSLKHYQAEIREVQAELYNLQRALDSQR